MDPVVKTASQAPSSDSSGNLRAERRRSSTSRTSAVPAWKVKLGEEARSETAASRLLWAAGYVVDEDYYRSQIRVRGLPRLARGQEFVSNGNTVTGARLERDPGGEDSTPWSWYDNPFLGTREFNGLKVMMALINNWDLKAVNNGASGAGRGGGQYGITDLGATLGRTGNSLNRSKGVVE